MSFETHLEALKRRHTQIKEEIQTEETHPAQDVKRIQQLKKEKLQIKDEIEALGQAADQRAA